MKLIEQQTHRKSQQEPGHQLKEIEQQLKLLEPFKAFKKSIQIAIKVHFIRFTLVSFIYYFSDEFLIQNERNSAEPWNSLLYFLAMMIEIIKFIGDCSLKNLLVKQQSKLVQICKVKSKTKTQIDSQEQLNQNVALKGASFEQYMSLFSMIQAFKYKHRNYSSAYSITKCMHIVCTFLIFGWMALKQQYNYQSSFLKLFTLQLFLLSIYLTSFQVDLYMIETSQGKYIKKSAYNLRNLSENQKRLIKANFKDWRQNYLILQSFGTLCVLIAILIQLNLTNLTLTAIVVICMNVYCYHIESQFINHSSNALDTIKRQEISTYSLLKKCATQFGKFYNLFIVLQRISFLFLWFSYARDQSLNYFSFYLIGLGLILFLISQKIKFQKGNSLKLMSILQFSYSNHLMHQPNESIQIQCAICLKTLQLHEKVKLLPCSKQHVFHSECFQDWKKYKRQCPLCRYELEDYI